MCKRSKKDLLFSFNTLFSFNKFKGDQINEGGMGGTCSMHVNMKNSYKLLSRKLEGERPLQRPRHTWNLKIQCVRTWTGFNWLRIGSSGSYSEQSYSLDFIKCRVFLYHLSNYQLLKDE
jgi:hypothetical protein